MRPNWFKTIAILAAIWLGIAGVMWLINLRKPTPEKIVEFVQSERIDSKTGAGRDKLIAEVAEKVNKLENDERRRLNESRMLEGFWKALSKEEKVRYSDLVTPQGFKVFFEAFNKMDPGKRKRAVEKAVRSFRENSDEGIPADVDPDLIKRIVDQGLKAFHSEATIEAKMDAMPFLEELEKTVKWGR